MKFTSIDEKIKELISEGITDELSDHLADVHKLIEDKLEEKNVCVGVATQLAVYMNSAAFDKFLTERIEEVINTKQFRGYLGGIIGDEIQEQFKKLPSDYAITLMCSALTRLVK